MQVDETNFVDLSFNKRLALKSKEEFEREFEKAQKDQVELLKITVQDFF